MNMTRRKGEALWSQIASELAGAVSRGELAIGVRLPTEAELAARFQVNRHTIRRALEELADARIIRTEHGRGSFVAEDVLDYRIGKRPRFSEWVRSQNRAPLGEVLLVQETALSALPEAEAAATALGMAPEDQVILLERVGKADDRAVALARHIFPGGRYPGLLAALQAESSITAALKHVGVVDFTRAWTRVSARQPDAREAHLLRMARTDTLLACESLDLTAEGQPLEFGATCYPAHRVQLVFES